MLREKLKKSRESKGLMRSQITDEIVTDLSIFIQFERSEQVSIKKMLPIRAKTLEVHENEIEIEFIKTFILSVLGELKFLKSGLIETLNSIKSRK